MIYKLTVAWYYIEVMYANLLIYFNKRKSIEPIPKNTFYCYLPDYEKNYKRKDTFEYWIKPCKYYRSMNGHSAACTYIGFIGFNPCLGDQCKMCNIK